ncbi:MAG TPA: helicase-related protein [Bacillota bacterium]|nr:helicase-related protein [Bacillota bacterium]
MISDALDSIYHLPIVSRHDEIVASVASNQVTIITAETGAGKSTQVPQYLAQAGYTKIIVTQPRILAARNLSDRVREEYSWRTGRDCTNLVGYRTAHEADDSPENVILYCTDGLQLVRELTGSGTDDRQVLILDEIHEWNENMEVLIAWAKKRCQEEPHFKIVLMSATMEADSLAGYYSAPAPITIEGRSFPVTRGYAKDLLQEIITRLERKTSNMLVFLPGKGEIEQVVDAIRSAAGSIPVIPLHSQLEAGAQQLAFDHYPNGKVVLATNIAQTSITIDDIDVVIDSGLERRAEVRAGVEGLFISEVSQADCIQRAGRAGRVKPGEYVLAQLGEMPCSPLESRPAYGVPEIMRKHIDRLVLRLANIGMDIESLQFFHAPSRNTIKRAKQTLTTLGALLNGTVTPLGRKMERFPVESSYSRMLVEGMRYTASVQSKLATIIAIQEVGGIVKGGPRHIGWQRYTRQKHSDLLAQYEVLLAIPKIAEEEYEDLGIIAKNMDKAMEVNERLHHDLGLGYGEPMPITEDEEEPLLKCIVAGQLHQIWMLDNEGKALDIATRQEREVSGTTVVKNAALFAGTPFDLEVATGNGLETLHLVNSITVIDPAWLNELAPGKFTTRTGKIEFDARLGALAQPLYVTVDGRALHVSGVPVLERTSANQRLFAILYSDYVEQQLDQERRALARSNNRHIPRVSQQQIREKIHRLAPGAISTAEVSRDQRMQLYRLARLETWLGKEFMDMLNPVHQDRTASAHGRHHAHRRDDKPKHKRSKHWRRDY